jgi:hypothetical protein
MFKTRHSTIAYIVTPSVRVARERPAHCRGLGMICSMNTMHLISESDRRRYHRSQPLQLATVALVYQKGGFRIRLNEQSILKTRIQDQHSTEVGGLSARQSIDLGTSAGNARVARRVKASRSGCEWVMGSYVTCREGTIIHLFRPRAQKSCARVLHSDAAH